MPEKVNSSQIFSSRPKRKTRDVNEYELISEAGTHKLWGTSHPAGYLTADTSWLLMTIMKIFSEMFSLFIMNTEVEVRT